jgi:hypothetical protein
MLQLSRNFVGRLIAIAQDVNQMSVEIDRPAVSRIAAEIGKIIGPVDVRPLIETGGALGETPAQTAQLRSRDVVRIGGEAEHHALITAEVGLTATVEIVVDHCS